MKKFGVCVRNKNSTADCSLNNSQYFPPPVIVKETIRPREQMKRNLFAMEKKSRYKSQHSFQEEGEIKRQSVNWVVFNILVGIYKNWLRLAPSIIYLLEKTQRDKLKEVNDLIGRILQEKEAMSKMMAQMREKKKNYHRRVASELKNNRNDQMEQLLITNGLSLLPRIQMSTQLLNGCMLSNNRKIKTEKQNEMVKDFFKKHNNNHVIYMNVCLKNVADSLMDRIQLIKFLHENKAKIQSQISSPVKKFLQIGNLDSQNQLDTEKIIEVIKANIIPTLTPRKKDEDAVKKLEDLHHQFEYEFLEKVNDLNHLALINENTSQRINSKRKRSEVPEKSELNHENRKKRSEKSRQTRRASKFRTLQKKKIGLINEDRDNHTDKIDHHSSEKKSLYKLYKERKVVLNKEKIKRSEQQKYLQNYSKNNQNEINLSREKGKALQDANSYFDNLKNSQNGKRSHDMNNSLKNSKRLSQASQSSQIQSRIKLKLQKKGSKDSRIRESHFDSQGRGFSDEEDDEIKFFQRNQPHRRKTIKLRRKHKKQLTDFFDKVTIEALNEDVMKEDNVIIKKKKILNFLHKIESQGFLKDGDLKKIIIEAKKKQKKNNGEGKKIIKRDKQKNDTAFEERDSKPYYSNRMNLQFSHSPEYVYKYLVNFHKEAVDQWQEVEREEKKEVKREQLKQSQKNQLYETDIESPFQDFKRVKYNYRWFERETNALKLSQELIKNMNDVMGQKGLQKNRKNTINDEFL